MECLAGPPESLPGLQDVSDDDADDADDDIDPALCDILPVEPVSGQSHASALQAGDDVDDGIAGAVRSSEAAGLAGGSKHASKSRGEVELKRITIEKDNNCLFNAIAYLCSHQGTQVSAAVLRKWIADGIQGNPESYTQAGLGIPPNEYCEWIQDERNWGGENEICMLCERFDVEIQVVMLNERATSLTYGEGASPARSGRIFLLYSGQHYDALEGRPRAAPEDGERTIKVFEAGSSETSSLAIAFGLQECEEADHAHQEVSRGSMYSLLRDEEHETLKQENARLKAEITALKSGDFSAAAAPTAPVSAPSALETFQSMPNAFLAHRDDTAAIQRASRQISSRLHELHEKARHTSSEQTKEVQDMIRSLKLAQEMTDDDLKMVHEQGARLPTIDPAVTSGIGLSFTARATGHIHISKVQELSAANFAGILPTDQLLSINDEDVRDLDDVKRCLGPFGSVVSLKLSRASDEMTSCEYNRRLVREISATRRAREEFSLSLVSGGSVSTHVQLDHLSTATNQHSTASTSDGACRSEHEARALVMIPTDLERKGDGQATADKGWISSFLSKKTPWRRVRVHVTQGGLLVVDKAFTGHAVVIATHSPNAAADLQELQLINIALSKKQKASEQLEASRCFQVHLAIGKRGHAFSQRGLLEVDLTQMIEFRARDPQEASTWVKGINALLSCFSLPIGTRPALAAAQYPLIEHGQLVANKCPYSADGQPGSVLDNGGMMMMKDHYHHAIEARRSSSQANRDLALAEMGFTESQISLAQDSMRLEAQQHLPSSLTDGTAPASYEAVLEWLLNNAMTTQGQSSR